MKKIISLILAVIMIASVFAGCGTAQKNEETPKETAAAATPESKPAESDAPVASGDALISNIPVEFPIVTEPMTFKIMAKKRGGNNDIYMWQKYQEKTGISVEWVEGNSEKVATALASGEELDLIMYMKISQVSLTEYGNQGLIVDLNEDGMLQKYAPNVWNYLQNHPDTLAGIMTPEGNIYGLPQVNTGAEMRVSRKLYINQEWLDNVGMELPTTTDELYEVLKAFKEQDANGNGDPNDEIPLCCESYTALQDVLLGAFGLGNRGQHNQIVDWNYETDGVRLIGTAGGYKDMLEYMHKLYSEGLIDQELFTMDFSQWTVKAADDRVGMYAHTNTAVLPYEDTSAWVGLTEALEGPNGDKMWAAVRANFHSTGNAVIPATCENVEEVLRWLDYFWTDEGALFYFRGVEGETFIANEDGTYDFTESVLAAMTDGTSYDDAVSKVTPYPVGGNPVVTMAPFFGGGETKPVPAATANALFAYKPEEIWPALTFTAEENEELSAIQSDITKYVNSATTEFITGTKSFDEWDAYVAQAENMRLAEMLEIYQAAVDRFHELIK